MTERIQNVVTYRIQGMDCENEAKLVRNSLEGISGIQDITFNFLQGTIAIVPTSSGYLEEAIDRAFMESGLKAIRTHLATDEKSNNQPSVWISANLKTLFSGILIVLAIALRFTIQLQPNATILVVLYACSIVLAAWDITPRAFVALKNKRADINLLMTIAVLGAMIIGEWFEGAMVAFLFSVSELLESFSVTRARNALGELMNLAPETAWLKQDDLLKEVSVNQVSVGEIVLIKSGARIPLDGEVESGTSSVNQAPITGESIPIEKKKGDPVFAGTINGNGSLEVRTTKIYSESTLSRIIHLIEEAQSQKAPTQRFIDVFSAYYTPAVILVSCLVVLFPPLALGEPFGVWFYRGLILLVISCPCALVISTPVSLVSGLTMLARKGVLVKGGAALEAVGKLKALAVDKTGTITEGKPRVVEVLKIDSANETEIVKIAASVDIHSDHPLAQAIIAYAKESEIDFPQSTDYQQETGRGARAAVGEHYFFVGNHRYAHELGACSKELEKTLSLLEKAAKSVVVVGHFPRDGCQGKVLGVLAISDPIRENAPAAVAALHAAGVSEVVMLSGDNQRTVDAIASEVGIDIAHGDLLPDDKTAKLKQLLETHKHVGMVGDGVNDAPAMALATVGIAMGEAGTDTAIETADIALMRDDLSMLVTAIMVGRATLSTIRMNITFALGVKAVFLLLAITGYTNLWFAILADTGATLIVIANSLRLLRFK